jgi:hypothetical protein
MVMDAAGDPETISSPCERVYRPLIDRVNRDGLSVAPTSGEKT